jgi:pyridoxal phosphate enzyme (YggS family)
MDVISRAQEIAKGLEGVLGRVSIAAKKSDRRPEEIILIVVTKTYPVSDVEILRRLGIKDFGENKDAEGALKSKDVPATWHFQGQIQSNKIRSISHWADVIHSLDDARHISLLEKAMPTDKQMRVFLQVGLDKSVGRGGANPTELAPLAEKVLQSAHLKLEGLMAVAPLGESPESAFERLATIHSDFCQRFPDSKALSAGMSSDFEWAIAYGATHVRIGSSILGSRLGSL